MSVSAADFRIGPGCLLLVLVMAGCSGVSGSAGRVRAEAMDQEIEAARKVLGGMSGREVTPGQMKQIVRDMGKDSDTRSAVGKITGQGTAPVEKYSPVTGKHYSGDLEFDPETGVRLEVIKD